MTVSVRALRPDARADLEGFARVRHAALPFLLVTPDSLAHDLTHMHPDAHYRPLVAVADGEVIGTAQVHLSHESSEPGQGNINVYVHPGHTRRGAGTLLVRAAEEHLAAHGATRLFAWVLDERGNRAFAGRHGYRASRAAHFLRLDLAGGALPPLQDPPPGVELRKGSDFAGDPRPLFELDAETTADEPSDVDTEFTDYEAWLAETWRHPLFSPELTSVALVDGRPAAFSAARTDGGTRYGTVMTGTARAHRGRGLAKLAKNDSLHRARAAGYTEAFTGNDAGNGPMIAINQWFGYEICATEVRHVRDIG
ncbi:GNAT family N-acetyltransferase [Streptomyces griseoloalbus]|uniref:GNAT superfamily N-acetyltransferase n=1 Tax=Streptomyces griseoloalbus TaxID=67303 RepID=A0A7W8BTZ8_9ACTN|nr:GNAT family N-acetyltransferase [Streptomyces albaduncus]MBB5129595.1 GNAT superfamily N-acetyltransferase [Streptomyces albaduncus]GGV62849.1 N-acetyltransferase [Streptomyces griseoloalbus]GGW69431.1 N-acetyltransferase [Streptomyces albaduncus]